MSKQHTDQRDRTLSLARILYEETDENHPMPLAELAGRLEQAGIQAERKSLYRDLAALKRHGLETGYVPGRGGGWYLSGRTFRRGELRQLIDAVSVYPWLTDGDRASLLDKLAGMAPAHQRPGLRRPVLRARTSPQETEEVREVLDTIHAALQNGCALTFYPVNWTPEKLRTATSGRVVVSPRGLLWNKGRYALVAWDHRTRRMALFFPHRMARVQVMGMPAQGPEVNLRHWISSPFGLGPDLRSRVKLRCRRDLAGDVLDRFGRETVLIPAEDGETFTFLSDVVVGPDLWAWLAARGDRAEVLSPLWAATLWQERYRPRIPREKDEQPPKAG